MIDDDDMITAGRYYGRRTARGPLEPASEADGPPDAVVCRRVVDYPNGRPPKRARLGSCTKCGELVAYNPQGRHLDKPRCCMQCAGIRPLPYES